MKEKIRLLVQWIPPIPSNFFKMGLHLGISYSMLAPLDKKDHTFFQKMQSMLQLAHELLGDDFPPRLYEAMEHLELLGLYTTMMKFHHLEDPFLLPACGIVMPEKEEFSIEHYINMLNIEVARIIEHEPCVDVAVALQFELNSKDFQQEPNMALRLFDMLTTAKKNLHQREFLQLLKRLIQDLCFYMVVKDRLKVLELPDSVNDCLM